MTKGKGKRKLQQDGAAEPGAEAKEGAAAESGDRRPLRFWQPFNDWWRTELEHLGRRPSAQEILQWYNANSYALWKDEAPTLQETRVHAKCLRSLPLVRDYFRNYRAKKRSSTNQVPTDDPEYKEEDDATGAPAEPRQEASAATASDTYRAPAALNQYGMRPGDFLHPAMLNPHAAALWSQAAQAAQAASLDPNQQELLRNITLTQLQHAAAVQQQLTLAAALAQNFAISRNVMTGSLSQPLGMAVAEAGADGEAAAPQGDAGGGEAVAPNAAMCEAGASASAAAADAPGALDGEEGFAAVAAIEGLPAPDAAAAASAHDLGILADASEHEAAMTAVVAATTSGQGTAGGGANSGAVADVRQRELEEQVKALQAELRSKAEALQRLEAELATQASGGPRPADGAARAAAEAATADSKPSVSALSHGLLPEVAQLTLPPGIFMSGPAAGGASGLTGGAAAAGGVELSAADVLLGTMPAPGMGPDLAAGLPVLHG